MHKPHLSKAKVPPKVHYLLQILDFHVFVLPSSVTRGKDITMAVSLLRCIRGKFIAIVARQNGKVSFSDSGMLYLPKNTSHPDMNKKKSSFFSPA